MFLSFFGDDTAVSGYSFLLHLKAFSRTVFYLILYYTGPQNWSIFAIFYYVVGFFEQIFSFY